MCLKFLLCGGTEEADDGIPASQPVAKPPNGHTVQVPPASGQLPSPAMNGLPSSAMNGVKPPGAAGDNKPSPHEEPGKFDTARKEADKKSEEAEREAKANPADYPISSTTADYMPSSAPIIKKAHKKDDSAKNGGQDADVTSRMNQDHSLRPSVVDVVGSRANRGRIDQDHERRASTNYEPIREAADNRFPRPDDIGTPANPIPRKEQPRRGARIY